MSKIVILTGSPRKKGNTTTLMNALIEKVKEKGHEVKSYDTTRMNVIGCRACESCYKNGKACIFDEGFNEIASEIEAADAVVLAAPVYWYGFPAQLKAVIDKFYSLYKKGSAMSGKKCALVAICGDAELEAFDGMLSSYQGTYRLMGWESLGQVLIPGIMELGDVEKTDGVDQVLALAEKF